MSVNSRYLTLILRHRPELIGAKLDGNGWVVIDDLLRHLRRAGRPTSRARLEQIVSSNDKKRFTISEDGKRIRAAQGHSIAVDLQLKPETPPQWLYHGSARKNLDSIFQSGLLPKDRQYVHLSPDMRTAMAVGRRHGKPVVLRIAASTMNRGGYVFLVADNGVWLTESVPPQFLGFGEIEEGE